LTAQNFGGSGLAVSIEPTDPWYWDTACEYASAALAWLVENAPPCTVLNLNVPGRPRDDVAGLRWAQLDQFGSVRAAVAEAGADGLQIEFKATGADLHPDSDTALVMQGYATLTAITGVTEVAIEPKEARGAPPTQVARSVERVPYHGDVEVPMHPLHLTGSRDR
jgi:5'-nucleotidase